MHWKRLVHAFLLGTGMSVVGVGCAAVDALVSSPAGRGASGSSPERLIAVGRVFENQGRMPQAQAMYRQALKSDPGNSIARERMEFIASMNSGRSFSPSELRSRDAIAVADSLQSKQQIKSQSSSKSASQQATTRRSTELESTLAAAGRAKRDIATSEDSKAFADDFKDDAGWIQIVETGWELAEMEESVASESTSADLKIVPANQQSTIETVSYDDDTNSQAEVVTAEVRTTTTSTEWRASSRSKVTFAELSAWIDSPIENQDNLLRALKSGEDDGVKALAAAMLTECSLGDDSINVALREACKSSSSLLKVTGRDTLIQRGAIDQAGVDELISLLSDTDADIRAQAAASLRNCAGTEWTSSCVEGLSVLLHDAEPTTVAVAASTLGDFGTHAAECTEQLKRLLQSDNTLISEAAMVALNRLQ